MSFFVLIISYRVWVFISALQFFLSYLSLLVVFFFVFKCETTTQSQKIVIHTVEKDVFLKYSEKTNSTLGELTARYFVKLCFVWYFYILQITLFFYVSFQLRFLPPHCWCMCFCVYFCLCWCVCVSVCLCKISVNIYAMVSRVRFHFYHLFFASPYIKS